VTFYVVTVIPVQNGSDSCDGTCDERGIVLEMKGRYRVQMDRSLGRRCLVIRECRRIRCSVIQYGGGTLGDKQVGVSQVSFRGPLFSGSHSSVAMMLQRGLAIEVSIEACLLCINGEFCNSATTPAQPCF